IKTLLRLGEREQAAAQLEKAILAFPFERALRATLADLLEGEGKAEQSLKAWRSWLEICPEDDAALVAVARENGLLGNREAKGAALRQAIALNPNLKDQRRYLEFLEAEVVPFYKPYELSGDAILAADPGPPADSQSANDPYYYLQNQRIVRAYRNGTTSEY